MSDRLGMSDRFYMSGGFGMSDGCDMKNLFAVCDRLTGTIHLPCTH